MQKPGAWIEEGVWPHGYRYIEAYMRLDAAILEKKARAKITECQWWDQRGELLGATQLITPFSDIIGITYAIDNYYASQYVNGTGMFRIARVKTNAFYSKPYFKCPVCDERSGILVLVRDLWACRRCQNLSYRSQFMGSSERDAARFKQLGSELQPRGDGAHRPRYMRQKTFRAKWSEYQELRAKFQDTPLSVPHAGLQVVLTPRWVEPPDVGG